jgi:uncharacterized delta-60 repeat protein
VGRSPTGKVVTAVGAGNDVINAMALQADGKIVVAGYTTSFAGGNNFIVARYNANGSLDTTFGNAGITVTDFGQSDIATGMAIQADGKIVVAGTLRNGSSSNTLGLARYNPNGSLDLSFGNQGKVVTTAPNSGDELDAKDVLIANGQILVGGYGPGGFIVARYQNGVTGVTDGTLDPAFGTGGIAQTYRPPAAYGLTFLEGGSLALQANGKIVIAGDALSYVPSSNSTTTDFAVARLESNGSPDDGSPNDSTPGDSFGTTGVVVTDFGPTFGVTNSVDKAHAVAIQADGKIVAAGESNSRNSTNDDFALARYQGDAPLLAAAAPAKVTSTILTDSQVQPLLNEALARWQAAGVDVSALKNLTIRIMDLSGNYLGMADGHTIYLDSNAAGWGWFVDPTPADDSEFTTPGNQGEQGHMDLLSVMAHEMGHVLGLDHDDNAADVMGEALAPGVRRMPTVDDISGATGGSAVAASFAPQGRSTQSFLAVILARGQDDRSFLSPYLAGVLAGVQSHAATTSLSGIARQAYGFSVSADGLGADSFNVGAGGATVGVAKNTTRNVYELRKAVNRQAVNGWLYNGETTLSKEANDLFDALNKVGAIS